MIIYIYSIMYNTLLQSHLKQKIISIIFIIILNDNESLSPPMYQRKKIIQTRKKHAHTHEHCKYYIFYLYLIIIEEITRTSSTKNQKIYILEIIEVRKPLLVHRRHKKNKKVKKQICSQSKYKPRTKPKRTHQKQKFVLVSSADQPIIIIIAKIKNQLLNQSQYIYHLLLTKEIKTTRHHTTIITQYINQYIATYNQYIQKWQRYPQISTFPHPPPSWAVYIYNTLKKPKLATSSHLTKFARIYSFKCEFCHSW
eukprot:TRINITY_DN10621_c0_g1_i1.p1 TRINITY_DN10621_c0_g1~~TRINITY_DN10621_c0_g1_i1.p1  ORF type:complete len:254 (-),score=-23.91 TRINITY_DN10621_c0_g1_i1:56-817(-)